MEKKLERGLVQVYTGNGKGKTTAAMGQAFRAIGRGYTVKVIQFLKSSESGELYSAKKFEPDFQIYRFERHNKFFWNMNEEEKQELKNTVKEEFELARKILTEEQCNILILDEIMGVINNNLISADELRELISKKPEHMELILTGRNFPEELLYMVDLVTEMKMIKHPFEKGITSRDGIEK